MSSANNRLPILLFLFLWPVVATAQGIYDHWYFGNGAGLHFTADGAVADTSGKLYAETVSISISDNDGNLLFYSDGSRVYNAKHQVMEGAHNMGGDPGYYALAAVPENQATGVYRIFYCKNKTLFHAQIEPGWNEGNGRVSIIDSIAAYHILPKITAVRHCNREDYWIVAPALDFSGFYAFHFGPGGLSSVPVVSFVSILSEVAPYGTLAASPLGNYIAMTLKSGNYALYLFDFDNRAGMVSEPRLFRFNYNPFGIGTCFSPDGRFLYFTTGGEQYRLWQMDLLAPEPEEMAQSLTEIAGGNHYALAMAPDGRIYIAKANRNYLSTISNPCLPGKACGYTEKAVTLNGRLCKFVLPDCLSSYFVKPAFQSKGWCTGDSTHFRVNFPGIYDSIRWEIQNPGFHAISGQPAWSLRLPDTGSYRVTLCLFQCGFVDTVVEFRTKYAPPEVYFAEDTLMMTSPPLSLGPEGNNYQFIIWNTGDITHSIFIEEPGTYWFQASNASCLTSDSIVVVNNLSGGVFFPNAFRPGKDGRNDCFRPITARVPNGRLLIYNRFGQLVFQTNALANGWNGMHNGRACHSGIYAWLMEDFDTGTVYKGMIYLLP